MTPHPSAVYATQLSELGFGHPLWFPESTNDCLEIKLGDVGYFDEQGSFVLLFNIDKQYKDDPARGMQRLIPAKDCNYIDLQPQSRICKHLRCYLDAGVYTSSTMQRKMVNLSGDGEKAQSDTTQYSSEDEAALCWLPENASLSRICDSNDFKSFLKSNVNNWCYHILQFNPSLKSKNMVIIHTTVNAPQYAIAVLSPAGKSKASVHEMQTLSLDAAGTLTILADPSLLHVRSRLAESYQPVTRETMPAIFIRFYCLKTSAVVATKNVVPQSEKRPERGSIDDLVPQQEGYENERKAVVADIAVSARQHAPRGLNGDVKGSVPATERDSVCTVSANGPLVEEPWIDAPKPLSAKPKFGSVKGSLRQLLKRRAGAR